MPPPRRRLLVSLTVAACLVLGSLAGSGFAATAGPLPPVAEGEEPPPLPPAGFRAGEPQGGSAPAGNLGGAAVGEPVFHKCKQIKGARCGRMKVWADPRFHELGTLRVGFIRYPRRDQSTPSQGTIVAVEGGPGYSSTGSRGWYHSIFEPLLDHRSLLIMDLRGTGRSGAIDCRTLQRWSPPKHDTITWAGAEAKCGKQLGPLSSRYGTAFAAGDLATLLDGLGIQQIDLYGDSYGTFFSQTFAVRYPERIRTLILDAAYPIEGGDSWWRDLNRAAINALRRSCQRDPGCNGDPMKALRTLARRTRGNPIKGFGYDADGERWKAKFVPVWLSVWLNDAGYGSTIDRELAAAVKAALRPNRDPVPLLRMVAENEWHSGGAGDVREYSQGLSSATGCNDDPLLWNRSAPVAKRKQQFDRAVERLQRNDPRGFDPITVKEAAPLYRTTCLRWPSPPDHVPAFPPGGTYPDVPTLVLVGEFDSVTSPEGARQVARDFPNSTFVEVPNSYHVVTSGNPKNCVDRIVHRFVRRLRTGDTSCVSRDYPPIRVVKRFPATAREVHGTKARRAATIAAGTIGDMMNRWMNMGGYWGVGLRGGTFKTEGLWTPVWWLHGARWVRDVPVRGTVHANWRTGVASAKVSLEGPKVPSSTLRIRWNMDQPLRKALVTGTVGGKDVRLRVPTPY